MSDDTPERPARFYGSRAEQVRGVDNIANVNIDITSTEVEFTVSYPNAEGYTVALPKSQYSGGWGGR